GHAYCKLQFFWHRLTADNGVWPLIVMHQCDRRHSSVRVILTQKYATPYAKALKKANGQILDTVVEITGWNRDHVRWVGDLATVSPVLSCCSPVWQVGIVEAISCGSGRYPRTAARGFQHQPSAVGRSSCRRGTVGWPFSRAHLHWPAFLRGRDRSAAAAWS